MNLTRGQIIAITIAVLSVLAGSTAQLTDLFGAGIAKYIISSATLANTVLSSVLAVITGQGSQIRDVLNMPGVERVSVNSSANATLAALAVDPTVNKIAPTAAAMDTVTATAKGNK